jgi:hypothetical protein
LADCGHHLLLLNNDNSNLGTPDYWLIASTTWFKDVITNGIGQPEQSQKELAMNAQCSLQSAINVIEPLGYKLIQLQHGFAVFRHDSVLKQWGGKDLAAHGKAPFDLWLEGWYLWSQCGLDKDNNNISANLRELSKLEKRYFKSKFV